MVPIVGAFFIDLMNLAVLTFFLIAEKAADLIGGREPLAPVNV